MWAHSLSPNGCSPKPVVEALAPQEEQAPPEPSDTGMLADRSAELSSLSRSFHLIICAELVEALQNLGEGWIHPKQLQLMVKHLEERYRDTRVEAVSMSDKTIARKKQWPHRQLHRAGVRRGLGSCVPSLPGPWGFFGQDSRSLNLVPGDF